MTKLPYDLATFCIRPSSCTHMISTPTAKSYTKLCVSMPHPHHSIPTLASVLQCPKLNSHQVPLRTRPHWLGSAPPPIPPAFWPSPTGTGFGPRRPVAGPEQVEGEGPSDGLRLQLGGWEPQGGTGLDVDVLRVGERLGLWSPRFVFARPSD